MGRMTGRTMLLGGALALAWCWHAAADRPAAVLASQWGWNAEDATACLQAALDSGAQKVVIDRQPGDWIIRPVVARSNDMEIVVADGVTVRAKKDRFKGRADCLFRILHATNVVLRGEGSARFAMNKADYQDPARYAPSEWRHTLSIAGGADVTVRDLVLESSGGDGVYVTGAARNVTLERLVCRDHHRQGISVISAIGLRVRSCRFTATKGTPPQCGIDIEPNHATERLDDLLFEDCLFDANAASGIEFYLGNLTPSTSPVSITFRRCISRGNQRCGISLLAARKHGPCRGRILFEDCTAVANHGAAFMCRGLEPDGLDVQFRNCLLDARGASSSAIRFCADRPHPLAGLSFQGTRVLLDPAQQDIEWAAMTGVGAGALSGTLACARGDREYAIDLAEWARRHPHDAAPLNFEDAHFSATTLVPRTSLSAPLAQPLCTGRLRGRFTFLQYVPAAGAYPIDFRSYPLPRRKTVQASFRLRTAAGADLGEVTIAEKRFTYVLKAAGPGVYIFETRTGSGTLEICSPFAGCGVRADGFVHLFGGPGRSWSFFVPAGGEDVAVNVRPEEPCAAELVDPSGKVVDSLAFGASARILRGRRPATDPGGVWCLRFPKIQEDAVFCLGAPATPVAAPTADPAAVLVPKTAAFSTRQTPTTCPAQ